ncbi:TetR/AcrR family transcriptional regulator [Streptomyces sp. TLI_171]|uniref:TetR/AcrR family transcriptional regulator n=1 Tax=Streptomyces sp. TLI_171 TaxID=1938859 RepID=UPI000C17E54C|nr:TetR/AcrR family transcriptional regulator [Streptomyces sp. TLI_171]RKE21900.1 TetR family transcriptional regulator [Streptomyces sp. TLI_171]
MGRTFTESARRQQIVAAAIEVIAEAGYAKASFARIAKQAGLSSTGMISYHFKGKDDLLREVVAEVLRVAEAYMLPRIDAALGPRGRMRAFIESNIELVAAHPRELAALVEILGSQADDAEGQFAASRRAVMDFQEQLVRKAQEDGEYGPFDARVLVTAVRGAIDAVLVRVLREPELDVATSARELADLFDRAVRPAEVCMEAHRILGEE